VQRQPTNKEMNPEYKPLRDTDGIIIKNKKMHALINNFMFTNRLKILKP